MPCFTGDDQYLAGRGDRIHQPAQPGQPGFPADDACGVLCGEFTGTWHLPVLSASAYINAVARLNSDRGPGMPAAHTVQSHHGYRLRQTGVTVKAGPGRIYYEDHGSGSAVVLVHAGRRPDSPERPGSPG